MKLTKSEQLFLEEYKTISHYREASSLIAWDLRTKAPRKGIKQRSETLSYYLRDSINYRHLTG